MKLNELTIKEAHVGLEQGDFSALELARACLDAIKEKNGELHAFLEVFDDVEAQAEEVDRNSAAGEKVGPLTGIPLAIKDNILIQGKTCSAASKILQNYVAAYNATVVKRLKEAGAIFLGRTNMDEFAMGSSCENSAFGPTKNPHDTSRVPGGSSGGSAAAVASHLCLGALGSDTGGSVREPAAFCGVVGLKPTYGRVSRYGLIAMASSLDQIGPLTKTVEDSAMLFGVLAGKDENDATTEAVGDPFIFDAGVTSLKGVRIGVPKEYFVSGMDPEIERAVRGKISALEGRGATIHEVRLPHAEHGLACYYILMPSEVSSNLARFDGMRYGYSAAADTLLNTYVESRHHGFGPEPKRRILLGTYALSSGYYDAYYKKSVKLRGLIARDFDTAFLDVDCLVTPTTPSVAFKLGEKISDPLTMYLSDIYTVSANLASIPAISVPCGKVDGMPVGLQIMGKRFDEGVILKVARIVEMG